eukprot:c9434_g1_i2.p1 GENE.c9434_g1_i2~~c9434_g1_i2.p1  ORF type:complete len:470 (+),score=65.89 c9434_g1_i2:380-1789(+)
MTLACSQACGPAVGAHNKYWIWLSYVIDSSLYPRFAAAYLAKSIHRDTHVVRAFIAMGIVVFVTLVKLQGTRSLVKLSTALSVISLVPSFIFLCFGLRHLEPDVLKSTGNGPATNWNDMLTWVLWLYSGVLNMSSVAREVKNPERSYLLACGALLTMDVIFVNFTPLWVSLSIDDNRSDYHSGHFGQIAGQIAGHWLTYFLTFGAQVSQIGIYNSVSVASDRYLASFLHGTDEIEKPVTTHVRPTGCFSRCLFSIKRFVLDSTWTGAPPYVMLINAFINLGLVWLPITATLNMTMAMVSISMLLLLYSFLSLKLKRPHLKRRYTVPGGIIGAFLIVTPCAILCVLNIVLGVVDRTTLAFGIVSPKIVFVTLAVSFGGVVHLIYRCRQPPPPPNEPSMLHHVLVEPEAEPDAIPIDVLEEEVGPVAPPSDGDDMECPAVDPFNATPRDNVSLIYPELTPHSRSPKNDPIN